MGDGGGGGVAGSSTIISIGSSAGASAARPSKPGTVTSPKGPSAGQCGRYQHQWDSGSVMRACMFVPRVRLLGQWLRVMACAIGGSGLASRKRNRIFWKHRSRVWGAQAGCRWPRSADARAGQPQTRRARMVWLEQARGCQSSKDQTTVAGGTEWRSTKAVYTADIGKLRGRVETHWRTVRGPMHVHSCKEQMPLTPHTNLTTPSPNHVYIAS